MQQPLQLSGPQWSIVSQLPLLHVAPLPQLMHCLPPSPQALAVFPGMQLLPRQQPLQLPGPHVGGTHWRPFGEQTAPAAWQSWHASPPVPHEKSCEPSTHVVPAQQPLGHVAESHPDIGDWHSRKLSRGLYAHSLNPLTTQLVQACPALPHALS